jgi:hypothetical protein
MNIPTPQEQFANAKALRAKFWPTTPPVIERKPQPIVVDVSKRAFAEPRPVGIVRYVGRNYGPFQRDQPFADFLANNIEPKQLNPKEIIAVIARRHNVEIADIIGRSRLQHHVDARQEAIAAIYVQKPELSLPRIGRLFDRDHTTCLYAVKKLGVWRGGAS